jgi:hypothetical protein
MRTLLALACSCSILATSQAMAQTVRYVDNIGSCDGLASCHASISDGIAAAGPADFILVFPGVYQEAVVVGQGKDNIFLQAKDPQQRPVIAVPPGASTTAITLSASGVHVQFFDIEAPDGLGVAGNGPGGFGALIRGNVITSAFGINLVTCNSSTVQGNVVVGGSIQVGQFGTSGCAIVANWVDGESGGVSIGIAAGDLNVANNAIRRNVVRGGTIRVEGELLNNAVEGNQVNGGGITVRGVMGRAEGTVIRRNGVRGGGIELGMAGFGPLGTNTVELNTVSGSPGDGIALTDLAGGSSIVRNNTSVDNAGCDINDTTAAGNTPNTWTNNRFGTSCGAATD